MRHRVTCARETGSRSGRHTLRSPRIIAKESRPVKFGYPVPGTNDVTAMNDASSIGKELSERESKTELDREGKSFL